MCCIFTCCGWMIDLLQRLWTFTMSCLISSAVCCSLLTASMSGIALGYNYSLAEYIDLKESNVSVYLKRGVFDDEVKDDTSWRRAGHLPVAGHLADRNLITASPEEESNPLQSGRRLDDSIFESNDANKYEGALLKLTAKAPDPSTTTEGYTNDLEMAEIVRKYPSGSLNQLKEIHSLVNKRKSNAPSQVTDGRRKLNYPQVDEKYLSNYPAYLSPDSRRLMNPREPNLPSSSLRKAVPSEFIGLKSNWMAKHPEAFPPDPFGVITYPSPVTPRPGIVKLTRPKPETKLVQQMPVRTKPSTPLKQETSPPLSKSIDEEMDSFKEKLLLDKFDSKELIEEDFLKKNKGKKYDADDYEDDIRGLPVRRKRQVIEEAKIINSIAFRETSIETNTETNLGQKGVKVYNQVAATKLNETRNKDAVSSERSFRTLDTITTNAGDISKDVKTTFTAVSTTSKLLYKIISSTV